MKPRRKDRQVEIGHPGHSESGKASEAGPGKPVERDALGMLGRRYHLDTEVMEAQVYQALDGREHLTPELVERGANPFVRLTAAESAVVADGIPLPMPPDEIGAVVRSGIAEVLHDRLHASSDTLPPRLVQSWQIGATVHDDFLPEVLRRAHRDWSSSHGDTLSKWQSHYTDFGDEVRPPLVRREDPLPEVGAYLAHRTAASPEKSAKPMVDSGPSVTVKGDVSAPIIVVDNRVTNNFKLGTGWESRDPQVSARIASSLRTGHSLERMIRSGHDVVEAAIIPRPQEAPNVVLAPKPSAPGSVF